ncbi:MAG TPA: hypothetical protein VN703_00435 [Candidatus Sulfopaludibacter sp.]|jgi:hypothetical protein|nr:hypothetical protein [Candidatus Sulfopaludibacter sp.]
MENKLNKIKSAKKWNTLSLSIVAFAFAFAILIPVAFIDSAHALTKYENCIINAANNHGKLSLSDVTNCYDNEFKGAKGSDANGHPL